MNAGLSARLPLRALRLRVPQGASAIGDEALGGRRYRYQAAKMGLDRDNDTTITSYQLAEQRRPQNHAVEVVGFSVSEEPRI